MMQNLGLLRSVTNLQELKRRKTGGSRPFAGMSDVDAGPDHRPRRPDRRVPSLPQRLVPAYLSRARSSSKQVAEAERFSEGYADLIRRGLEYSVQAFRPSGTGVPWGTPTPTSAP